MADRFFGWHTIFDDAGNSRTPYMTRVWIGRLRLHVFHRGDNDPDHHDHPWDFWTFPLTSYVEEVAVPDIKGLSYMEALFCGPERYKLHRQIVRAFRLSYRPAIHCHRVLGRFANRFRRPEKVDDSGDVLMWNSYAAPATHRPTPPFEPAFKNGKVITIVWRGKGGRKWGFLKNRDGRWCWTPWKEYVFGGTKHAPCEPSPTKSTGGDNADH